MKDEIMKLINENENLIYKIASNYSNVYPIDDLFQVGVIGLMSAYKNFEGNKGVKFSTYAYQYILGEIVNFVKKDRNIKVNKNSMKILKMYEKSKEALSQTLKKEPSFKEICDFMELDERSVYYAIKECKYSLSLDSKIDKEEETTFIDNYGVDNREEIDELIDLKNQLLKLSDEERKLIELRYYQDYTQSETATFLGMSQVQVSRCEKHVLTKIRKNIVC